MCKYTRLRQICLVAHDIGKVVDDLCDVFAIEVCHRDPNVAHFGLVNALMPVGTSFIEVVSPKVPGSSTAAGRYLDRRGGDGGYMVINDCDDVGVYRDRAAVLGIRAVEDRSYAGKADLLQLHPRDTGGAILEFDHHVGGESLDGSYHWAGSEWHQHVRTSRVHSIRAVVLQSDDAPSLAERWGTIFKRDVREHGSTLEIALDNALVRFVPPMNARGEGICSIEIGVSDRAAIVRSAKARGLCVTVATESIDLCGVSFRLCDAP